MIRNAEVGSSILLFSTRMSKSSPKKCDLKDRIAPSAGIKFNS